MYGLNTIIRAFSQSRINKETKHRMIIVCTVQIILEGMGRALHTNFNARFKCDALKVRFGVHVSFGI